MRALLSRVYSSNQEHTLNVCVQIVNMVSFIACLIVVFLYLKFKIIQSLATKILCLISISGIFSCFAIFLSLNGTLDEGGLCMFQAFIVQFSSIASLLFSTLITLIIYKILLKPNTTTSSLLFDNLLLNKIQIVIWSVSILSAIIPLFVSNAYGPTGGICWIIQTKPVYQWLRYLMFYIPWFLCVVLMIYLSFKVTKYAFSIQYEQDFENEENTSNNNMGRVVKTIWYYPLIILFFFIFFAMRRANELVTGQSAVFALAILSLIFGYSRQIMNMIIFCFTPNVKQTIKNNIFHANPDNIQNSIHSNSETNAINSTQTADDKT